jgi:hypothetical protein
MNEFVPNDESVPNDIPASLSVSSADHEFFVRLNVHEKTAVVRFHVLNQCVALPVLRKMTARHQHMSKRESGETIKSCAPNF